MNRKTILAVWLVAGIAVISAAAFSLAGTVPSWFAGAVIVVAFPVFALFLCLWWMAPGREGDIPFVGY